MKARRTKKQASVFRILVVSCVVLGLLAGLTVYARNERVSPRRHPNLAEAQRLIERAREKLSDAQRANEFDMNGHARKAKGLLDDAYVEIKLAAEAANENR